MDSFTLDFDHVWHGEGDFFPTHQALVDFLTILAKRWGGTLTCVAEHGPGGGNPAFTATFPSKERARRFLLAWMCDADDEVDDILLAQNEQGDAA